MRSRSLRIIVAASLGLFGCREANHRGYQWELSEPEAQGMNHEMLDSAFTVARLTGFVDGLLVIRHGYLVGEEYYNGYNASSRHTTASVSKSFLSALTGLALQNGYLDSLEEKVMDYFPEYAYPGMDSRKYLITIRHLLTMRMGIRDESDSNYGVFWQLYKSPNWIQATIEYPLMFDPGERMRYNTFQTHLLSAILTKATGRSTREFGRRFLFDPIGITLDNWQQDPQGYYFGGGDMFMTPREMAVFGYLYLHGGRIDGRQIIPESWVQLTLSASTSFTHPNAWGELRNYDYAYLWWLGQIAGQNVFMGYGYGGQFLIVFPDLDLIVVSTAEKLVDPDTSTIQEWGIFDIIASHIVPAVTD